METVDGGGIIPPPRSEEDPVVLKTYKTRKVKKEMAYDGIDWETRQEEQTGDNGL